MQKIKELIWKYGFWFSRKQWGWMLGQMATLGILLFLVLVDGCTSLELSSDANWTALEVVTLHSFGVLLGLMSGLSRVNRQGTMGD